MKKAISTIEKIYLNFVRSKVFNPNCVQKYLLLVNVVYSTQGCVQPEYLFLFKSLAWIADQPAPLTEALKQV